MTGGGRRMKDTVGALCNLCEREGNSVFARFCSDTAPRQTIPTLWDQFCPISFYRRLRMDRRRAHFPKDSGSDFIQRHGVCELFRRWSFITENRRGRSGNSCLSAVFTVCAPKKLLTFSRLRCKVEQFERRKAAGGDGRTLSD